MSSNGTITPSALVNIFSNALSNDATRKPFTIKGIYVPGKGANYSGVYYDSLKDEYSDASITLVVPAILRANLEAGQVIECSAYLTKKVQANGARIELQVNVMEVHSQEESKLTDDQIKTFDILQRKAAQGYKDVDRFIKTKIIQQQPVSVTIIIGRTGIIDSDIKHQLRDALAFFDFNFVRVSLSNEGEIVEALRAYDQKTDVLVLSRGGGENMSIFNRPILAEVALGLQSFFVTAIGHKEDVSLLQKIADKHFITPTALGQYFQELYTHTMEELQHSKAKLIADVTSQLKGSYEGQLQNLQDKLKNANEFSEMQIALKEGEIKKLQNLLNQKKAIPAYIWIIILLCLVVGFLVGKYWIRQ
jgi:exodeoxyribonuclease VII large subunit